MTKFDKGIELVFEYEGREFVVEYDMEYDMSEYWVDVQRVETYTGDKLSAAVFSKALAVADADAALRHAEIVEDYIASNSEDGRW